MTRNDIVKIMHEAGFNLSLRGHPDFPEKDNDGNLLFWTSGGNKEFQAIFALAYEAGRKYENEVCAKEVDRWIGCDLLAAAIRARLAQPEPEPVGWIYSPTGTLFDTCPPDADDGEFLPLYTAPPKKEWVGLTDEDIAKNIYVEGEFMLPYSFESSIEAKLKEKNNG